LRTVPRLELHPFDHRFLDDAASLLARRHAAHRLVEPTLPPAYEQADTARAAIAELLTPAASGAVATRGGSAVGFVLGTPRGNPIWGPNVWVEPAGHAASEPEAIRDLYAHAAARWVEERRTAHYAVVPASDAAAVDAWFRLGFGHQHVHALREVPAHVVPEPPAGVTVRPACRDDLDALAELDAVLPRHQALSPCFSVGEGVPPLEVAREEWLELFDDGDDGGFVAEQEGRIVASGYACSVERSSGHSGLARPEGAALLAYAAVEPGARGSGIGQALAQAALAWARAKGYEVIVTDWRMTNLLSSRAWPRAGYRPTFFRLFRAVT
jgi:GNAT superfamily N-acetyltransferase